MNVDYKEVGARIKAARKKCGYTQEVLAERLNVTVGYVSQVERGATKISLDLLAAVSDCLECDLAGLISGVSVHSEYYLSEETEKDFRLLTQKERRLVRAFIRLLLENRA